MTDRLSANTHLVNYLTENWPVGTWAFFSNLFLGVVDSGKHGESLKRIKRQVFFPELRP